MFDRCELEGDRLRFEGTGWKDIEAFKDGRSRRRYWQELLDLMLPWFQARKKEEIYRLCQENDIPAAAAYSMDEVLRSLKEYRADLAKY